MGTAIMGTGKASGENRAAEAAKEAINSPLLEDISISGAKGLLMNICGSPSMTMEEIDQACTYIKGEVDKDAEIFWGVVFDENMGDDSPDHGHRDRDRQGKHEQGRAAQGPHPG